ncbi:hypothetical protein QBC41DRAFT_331737 [Cercophora samala]|uniref:Uncharacterized protein n=1 Tax=Cercophora samala TaxID=330535 RepID=A0AA40D150_9PEZI|nr:hypothetical protein QBC41DRAFT_331737 [Cercophora samala]
MKLPLLPLTTSLLALGQSALASPLVSPRQDSNVIRTLRCDAGTGSIDADTAKCAAETVFCKATIGVVITAGTPAAYNCLRQCSCV